MKLIARASLAFKQQKPASKATFGNNVTNALKALVPPQKGVQPDFSNLPVPIAELEKLNAALAAAVADALTGNHTAIATLKSTVLEWNEAFTQTANYVTTVAAGDVAAIRSTGFVPTKTESQPKAKPGPTADFKATINGFKGAIIAGAKKAVPAASAYVYAALPNDASVSYDGNMMIINIAGKTLYISADTRKQTELYNLPSGVPYNVSMYAFNRAGSGPASASQQVIPQ